MPITVGLGLSTLDRSFFSFRKVDRSSVTPSPDGFHSIGHADLEAPPELPPLGALTWSNSSFTKLLDQLEPAPRTLPLSSTNNMYSIASKSATTTKQGLATEHTSPSAQDDSVSPLIENSESMTTEEIFTTTPGKFSSTVPERQQSSTSTTSLFKRSDSSSAQSSSSKSSVEVSTEQVSLNKYRDPELSQPSPKQRQNKNQKGIKLDLISASTQPISISSPPLNTNKPLPPAPSTTLQHGEVSPYKVSVPELESVVMHKESRKQKRKHHDRSVLVRTAPQSSLPPSPSRQHITSQSLKLADADRPILPRRNSARLKLRQKRSVRSMKKNACSELADPVILQIFQNLQSFSDIKSVVLLNSSFYRVFKRHESRIVEEILCRESSPAWELRQLVKREQKRNPYKLRAVQRDIAALRALQAFIMMRCNKICRKSTLDGLSGEDLKRRAEIEDALWRIWTFCKLFGKGTSRDAGIHTHISWLEGNGFVEKGKSIPRFGTGNQAVSKIELEDMSELWRCMELLMAGFKGRETEARQAGIFDQCEIDEGHGKSEAQYLEDWTYDILSVGPKAVLTMISCSFEHAKVLGVTKWTPPKHGRSRRSFLKAALEQVYRDRLVDEARVTAQDFAKSVQQQNIGSRSLSETPRPPSFVPPPSPTLRRSVSEAPKTQVRSKKPEVTKLEIRPDCDPQATFPEELRQIPTISPTTNPASFTSLAMMSNASTRLGATLFPMQQNLSIQKIDSPIKVSSTEIKDDIDEAIEPTVIDPTDRAVALLTKQLGFPEKLAKQALAMSDDGAGIDVHRAVQLLSGDRRLESATKPRPMNELADNLAQSLRAVQVPKDYAEIPRRPVSMVQRKKSNLRGLMSRNSFRQSFPLGVIIDREDEDSAIHQLAKSAITPVVPMTMPTIQEHVPEKKIGYHNLTEFLKHRHSHRSPVSPEDENSFLKGHKKSLSTGSVENSTHMTTSSMSPVSPMDPVVNLGSCLTIRPFSEQINGSDRREVANIVPKPKVTLTRVGTGKKPSKRMSLIRTASSRRGEPPEIIGYTY